MENGASFQKNIGRFIKAGIFLHFTFFFALSFARTAFPYNICYDAFNWIPAQHLLEGKNPYSYALTEPYSMNPYGIIFYILFAVGVKLFGLQLWFGKLLSAAAFALCLRLAAAIAKNLGVSQKGVLIVVYAALAMYPAQVMFGCSRSSDIIGTAFALAALFFIFRDAENAAQSRKNLLFITLCVSGAYFTKQTFILPLFIAAARFVQLRKYGEIIRLTLFSLIFIGSGTFLLDYTSNGGYLWQHYTYAKVLPYTVSDLFLHAATAITSPAFLFALIFLGFYLSLRRKEIFSRECLVSKEFLLLIYLLISIVKASLMTGRVGGDVNYFIEASCLLAIYSGIVFDKWLENDWRETAAAMIFLLAVGNVYQMARLGRGELARFRTRAYYDEVFETSRRYITPQSVCVSVYPELVAWNGCRFDFDDFTNYSVGWSPQMRGIFDAEIKRGKYDVIIWDGENLAQEFPNYKLVPMKNPTPGDSMQIFLFVRQDLLDKSAVAPMR